MVEIPALGLPRTPSQWLRHLFNNVLFSAVIDVEAKVRLRSLVLVLVLPGVLLYSRLGFMLLEPDEGRYAQIPREMLQSGNWVVPTLQGVPYLDKPPLLYWLVAASYALFGVNESAARIVPAVAVHLTILLVYWLGRRSVGERAAMWAALLLTVSPGFLGIARFLVLDGLLTVCVTASVLCGYEAVREGRVKLGWWTLAAIASGVGFLTKGPISEILLFPPLFVFAWLTRGVAKVRWSHVLLFGAIVVGVNLPWYVAMGLQKPEFLRHFFWDHNVMRFLKPFDHLEPVWYYVPILLGGFLPGVVFTIPHVRSLLRGEPQSLHGGFWLLAGAWCVLFFSVSGSKLPTYVLPAYPFLCLALGTYIAGSKWNDRIFTAAVICVFFIFIAAVNIVALPWYARVRSPMYQMELVRKYVADRSVVVLTHPRGCDSVAFYTGRSDFRQVRSKDINNIIVDCHFRPRTVILFTHNHSLHAFQETLRTALNSKIRITETVDMAVAPTGVHWLDKLIGSGPWGLCDIAVVEP